MPNTKYADLVDQVINLLGTVTDVGRLHRWDRVVSDQAVFQDLFKFTPTGRQQAIMRGWTVSRSTTPADPSAFPEIHRTYTFVLRGYNSLQDQAGSELVFNDLIENVMDTLDAERDLNGEAELYGCGPTSLLVFEPRQFGSILAHYCEIQYPVIVTSDVVFA